MDNKYFIPEKEEIRIGYECEIFVGDTWIKTTVGETYGFIGIDAIISLLKEKKVRVAYLTKRDIVDEGWKILKKSDNNYIYAEIENIPYNTSTLRYDISHTTLAIYNVFLSTAGISVPSYYGECADVNTFRYIIKKLKIKNERTTRTKV